ncbi:erythromycin esterase family protein [Flammeovirga sp. SJP92]|uniref:erythromycin esterase family protein n=1 Tax=Flammeovirga sp. SJP92 TaxID=1775430 RepID=UPI000789185A|nr:erythromycin esterase family protein [Flammeovirga sp. SJP92]KXX68191.1 hypothetical protein AVL50_20555 [Flammeovirga sp. SJP92]
MFFSFIKLQSTVLYIFLFIAITNVSNAQTQHPFFFYDTLDYHQFDALKKDIGDAQIVLLAEPDHFHGNIFTAKIEVMKMLHETMGFDMIIFESGFYGLNKAHEAIEKGENKKWAYTNCIFPIWHTQAEFHPFMDYVVNNYDSIKVMGMDNQISGFNIENAFREDFSPFFNSVTAYQDWYKYIEFISEYHFPEEEDLEGFLQKNKELKQRILASSVPQKKDLAQTVYFISETAKDYYYNKVNFKSMEEFKAKDSNIRDRLMAENTLYLMEKYPHKKMIVWGATGHLMNSIRGTNEGLDAFSPMGSYVKKKLKDQAYILGFTGKVKGDDELPTIENEFYATSRPFGFLPLSTSEVINSSMIGTVDKENIQDVATDWSKVVDGIFFVDAMRDGTAKLYNCGESVFNTEINIQNDTLQTTYSFELQKEEKVEIPSLFFKDNASFKKQKGVVYDNTTKAIIPYASVITTDSKRGTASNEKGQFVIAIPSKKDSIVISSIGYKTIKIAPSNNVVEIYLEQKVDEMTTLTISSEPITAKGILKKVIKAIPDNYNQEPHTKVFYNEFIYTPLGTKDQRFYKMDFEVYDKNGYKPEMMFPMRYTGFRKVLRASYCPLDAVQNDTVSYTVLDAENMNKFAFGNWLYGSDIVNVRNNNFLNRSKTSKYDFEFSDVIVKDGKEIYVLKFSTEETSFRSTVILEPKIFYGTLYIDAESYAILEAKYSVVHDVERLSHYWPYTKYPLKELSFSDQRVVYKKQADGFYYLSEFFAETNIPDKASYSHLILNEIKIGEREREEGLSN